MLQKSKSSSSPVLQTPVAEPKVGGAASLFEHKCVAEQPAPDTTGVQILPRCVIIEDPGEEDFKPEVVADYRRIVGTFIQIFELHQQWLIQGEYFAHIAGRERAFQDWLNRNGGNPRGGP